MKITLHKDKTTPGTVRFKEFTSDHPQTLYIDKGRVAELGDPEVIELTIEKVS